MTRLGVFSLAMMTAGSVDSIRNLPATALFGSSLIFFFILGALFFLLPCALVSAELASTSKSHGGIYAWVNQAFGQTTGFLAVWFQWIENVIWYPTILSFVAGTVAYIINPALTSNKIFLIAVILTAFWGTTLINLLGIKSSAFFGNICAVLGLLVPMTLIIALGAVWIFTGNPLQIEFTRTALLPQFNNTSIWVSLTGIMMSFCGMEIAAVHSSDVRDPQRSYPRAMLITTAVILLTLICGSLAIAVVLPEQKISLVAGIMQAFDAFFSVYHLQWLLPLIAMTLVVGGMGGVNNWIIAPTRGLMLALRESRAPAILSRCNRRGAPKILLLSQAVIVTIITLIFLLLPTINSSYWLLTALAAQLYMLMYIIMFIAAIRLRYKNVARQPGFVIPGGQWGMWIVAGAGLMGSIATFIIGFIPPDNMQIDRVWNYEGLLLSGLLLMTIVPFFAYLLLRSKVVPTTASLREEPVP
ncbi:MAG: transporter [Coxiella sp. RIFCSPHIGHO2_12_FULL_42_15]|nr:MAG: transporter [Coxiella sp. RIFCSPHIGHO2_12_FULL_42_15]